MKNKIVGIIGGMGPEATSDFYLELTRMTQENCSSRPSILISSLPIEFSIEENFIKKGTGKEEFFKWICDGIRSLEKSGVNFIVIPCNTVHIFIEKLRERTKIPILSITEETARVCSDKKFKKVGLLSTELTIKQRLYDKEFEKNGVKLIKVNDKDQKKLSNIIHKIVIDETGKEEQISLERMIEDLKNRGSEAIILGCTDLQILIKNDMGIEIIDSMHTLAKATFERLLTAENKILSDNMSKSEEVKQFIRENSIQAEIIEHKQSGLTSEAAAEATGIPIENIIKTLLFIDKKKRPIIVICLGNVRVDLKKVSKISGLKKLRFARPDELKELLGTEPGGTPPICLPEEIPKFIDRIVMEKEFVAGSAGTEFTGLKIHPSDTVKFTNAKIVDIGE